ncbi:hypothetical protein [Inmirania thermothiophila]|uniref:Uncharacterized protein n=1 Tax=Inmirania thermothiophila TaxID=1750597 RepID=A0A3N1XSC6_9GAMM|nr:hypothetical protein [Inmirania thermothiophila]ROR29549.1 hypothetical protein EDC57_2219 [Inmirania thermothiophila]
MRAGGRTRRELRPEDALRLEALARLARAVRIDEARGEVRGLVGRSERGLRLVGGTGYFYLEAVRDLLARVAVGEAALRRGPLRRPEVVAGLGRERLAALPRLGDPELVAMMPLNPALDEGTAEAAWWAAPSPELGALLLGHPAVAGSALAAAVAAAVLEHLPFTPEAEARLRMARGLLAGGVPAEAIRSALARRAPRDPALAAALLEREAAEGGPVGPPFLRRCDELLAAPRDRAVVEAVLALLAQRLPAGARASAAHARARLADAGADGTLLERRMGPVLAPLRRALAELGGWPAPAAREAAAHRRGGRGRVP